MSEHRSVVDRLPFMGCGGPTSRRDLRSVFMPPTGWEHRVYRHLHPWTVRVQVSYQLVELAKLENEDE